MVEWNGIFRLFRFSGILGQPHEVHTKFRKEIPENVCSIRSTTRNFRKFWSNGKRPCCSRNFFFLTVADVSEVQETLWNVWPQNVLFFFQTAIFNPNAKPAQYSKCHIRLHLLFSVLQLFVSRSKKL